MHWLRVVSMRCSASGPWQFASAPLQDLLQLCVLASKLQEHGIIKELHGKRGRGGGGSTHASPHAPADAHSSAPHHCPPPPARP